MVLTQSEENKTNNYGILTFTHPTNLTNYQQFIMMTDTGGNDAGAQATTHHGSGGFAQPPALPDDGRGYDEWKKMVKLWSKFTN